MSKKVFASLLVLGLLAAPRLAVAADEVAETLARAEALYYEADFTKSIELLLHVDEMLRSQPGHLPEKTAVKLQLALAYIGLNESAEARNYFRALYEVDPEFSIDSQQFSPKVVQLAEQARQEQSEIRCRTLYEDVQRQLSTGKAESVLQSLVARRTKCPAVAALAAGVADLFFKEGLDAYRSGRLEIALRDFRSALQIEPKHELSAQYVELAESKLQLDADRTLIAWRKDFSAGDFAKASEDYRQLVARAGAETIGQVRAEYRAELAGLVESWNRACAKNDVAAMDGLREKVIQILPDVSIGEDILAKMTTCTPAGCVQMNTALVLARLRRRVDPEFSAHVINQVRQSSVTVHVKARINEKGDLVSSDMQGGNPILFGPVRAAVEQWKFSPVVIQGEPRCVDTEIPFVINFAGSGSATR
jgi:tetratricopeptide (TPR) repeat protein